MLHQEFVALSGEQRRNLPDLNDGFLTQPDHPTLIFRYNQLKHKSLTLFDPTKRIVTIFKKTKTGQYHFTTTCSVSDQEANHLIKSNGNFVTDKVLNNKMKDQYKNDN